MSEVEKFPETVFIIDIEKTNVITGSKKILEEVVKRPLGDMDLSLFLTYMALDAGLREGENEIMVFFVCNRETDKLINCNPSNLKEDVHEMFFSNHIGAFNMFIAPGEDIASRGDVFLELAKELLKNDDIKKLIMVPDTEVYKKDILDVVAQKNNKEVFLFRTDDIDYSEFYKNENLLFPLLQAMGVKGEE